MGHGAADPSHLKQVGGYRNWGNDAAKLLLIGCFNSISWYTGIIAMYKSNLLPCDDDILSGRFEERHSNDATPAIPTSSPALRCYHGIAYSVCKNKAYLNWLFVFITVLTVRSPPSQFAEL